MGRRHKGGNRNEASGNSKKRNAEDAKFPPSPTPSPAKKVQAKSMPLLLPFPPGMTDVSMNQKSKKKCVFLLCVFFLKKSGSVCLPKITTHRFLQLKGRKLQAFELEYESNTSSVLTVNSESGQVPVLFFEAATVATEFNAVAQTRTYGLEKKPYYKIELSCICMALPTFI